MPFYYFALIAFALAFWFLRTVVRSPFGLTLVGIRESESRMRTLGYNVWLHRYLGFVIAGAFGGFAGVFWAYYNGFVSPADLRAGHLGGDAPDGGARRPRHAGRARPSAPRVIVLLKNLVSASTRSAGSSSWAPCTSATILFAPRGHRRRLRQWHASARTEPH